MFVLMEQQTKNSRNLILTLPHVLFWLTFLSINSILVAQVLPFEAAFKRMLFNVSINIIVYWSCYRYLVPRFFASKAYSMFYLYAVTMLLVACVIRYLVEPLLIAPYELFSDKPVIIGGLIFISQAVVIFIASLLAILKKSYYDDFKLAELKFEKKEADLNLLKAKINPHFLLNTLNNIYSKSYSEKNPSAEAVLQLSRLLQYTIYETEKEHITLQREIETVNALIGLYELKYDAKLNIRFVHPPEEQSEVIEIPPLIVFTLFENAIKYSGIGLDEQAFITASLITSEKQISFEIENSILPEANREPVHFRGFGLKHLDELLQLSYPGRFQLKTNQQEHRFHIQFAIDR